MTGKKRSASVPSAYSVETAHFDTDGELRLYVRLPESRKRGRGLRDKVDVYLLHQILPTLSSDVSNESFVGWDR